MRVLTSKENLERIEEKEKEKQKKVKEKAERAKAREAKKMLKEKACSGKKSAKETFTDSELSKFNRAYEEGYDIKTNERYNLWLETFHGDILNQDYSESGMLHYIT